MDNKAYIEYLNTLHNVSANNQNAYTESNTTNPFFQQTMVPRDVGKFIQNLLLNNPPHMLVLTGHAGDGKTALLYQTLKEWGSIKPNEKLHMYGQVLMPNGNKCTYIKDYSELDFQQRKKQFEEAKLRCLSGEYTFLVANTGPLISNFEQYFSENDTASLIEQIDSNHGRIVDYSGLRIAVINVASIDNSAFVKPFLQNVLSDDLWEKCATCSKSEFCPIYNNRNLVIKSIDKVSSFISKHYIYQQEHGKKLTIRQIVAHLSFSITGGRSCARIKNIQNDQFNYLFSNLFFGFVGVNKNEKALSMKAISDIYGADYDRKRLRADESLFIKKDFSVFSEKVRTMLEESEKKYHSSFEWQQAVRRAYYLLNIDTSETNEKHMLQDVFSYWFPRFLELRNGKAQQSGDKELIQDALQMLFTDSIGKQEKEIPVTMKRESGVTQCVQLVYDSIQKKRIKLVEEELNDYSTTKRYIVYMEINGDRVNTALSLPLINYFEEIRKGAIATNIDPMLSQGIDSLKAQIIAYCDDEKDGIELLTLSNSGWNSIVAELDDNVWKIE